MLQSKEVPLSNQQSEIIHPTILFKNKDDHWRSNHRKRKDHKIGGHDCLKRIRCETSKIGTFAIYRCLRACFVHSVWNLGTASGRTVYKKKAFFCQSDSCY